MSFKTPIPRIGYFHLRDIGSSFLSGLLSGRFTGTYWQSVLLSAILLAVLACGFGIAAGVPISGLISASAKIAALQIVTLFVLFWPVLSVSIRRLSDRDDRRCWGAAVYPLAALALMQGHFNKPFDLATPPQFLPAIAMGLVLLLAAWVFVEMRRNNAAGMN